MGTGLKDMVDQPWPSPAGSIVEAQRRLNMRKTVYIAGPMTGKKLYNFPEFDRHKRLLEIEGYNVISPADLDREAGFDPEKVDDDWEMPDNFLSHCFERDLMAILWDVDEVVLLPEWETSRGACIEASLATLLGKPVWEYTTRVDINYDPRPNSALEAKYEAPTPVQPDGDCLKIAASLVGGDRGADYGHPYDDYARTGAMWGAILAEWAKEAAKSDRPLAVSPDLAVEMMKAVKSSRNVNKWKLDNDVDSAGYTKCHQMIVDKMRSMGYNSWKEWVNGKVNETCTV